MGMFGERLIAARKRHGWKQSELARRAGVPQQSIQAIESSNQKSSKYLIQLANALHVSGAWLLGGDVSDEEPTSPYICAPVRGLVAAGLWQEDDRQIADDTPVPCSPNPRFSARPQIAFRVVGNSMDRFVADGEYIICIDFAESPMHLRDGDIVVAERHRGGATERTVKRVRMNGSQLELWPESTDPAHREPLLLTSSQDDEVQVVIAGIVIGFYRPL